MESSNFKTVEALVSKIGQLTFQKYDGVAEVVATVTKPNAFSHVEGVGVSSTMVKDNFKDMEPVKFENTIAQTNRAFNLPVENEKLRIIPVPHCIYCLWIQYWKSSRKYYQFIRIVAKIWNHHRSNFIIVHF